MDADDVDRFSADSRLAERVATVLERVLPWVAWMVRPFSWLVVVGGVGALGLIWLLIRATDPSSVVGWLVLLVVAVVLLAPAGVLLLCLIFLRQLLGLPDQLRAMPGTAREQGARLVATLSGLRNRGEQRPVGLARGIWRLRGAFLELGGLLEPFLSLAGLVRLPFLVLVVVAIAAVGIEVAVFVVALLVVAVA